MVKILFDEIAPKYSERNGGYTRIIKLGIRDNDCASVSLLEFVDYVEDIQKRDDDKKKSKKSRKEARKKAAAEAEETSAAEAGTEEG